ncbi:STM3941 family protein [Bacteroides sp. 51]|uniref:STM3941 family protein n=1 Tax=Bacteroides sp. 51 TaxID=2302938 RepID=UPI0013D5B625|nr:STM3941 family protein [Bacteroides sp. 51]NDV83526.1 hypothetical protein [Bacteroides sp. 51]
MEKIEIPLSKAKLLLVVIGSILFVVFGVLLLTGFADNHTRYTSTFVKEVGVMGVVFFGATGILGARKMFSKNVGLTIDDNGILDSNYASSIGVIKWEDITHIETMEISSTKFLLIYTVNPEYYLSKAKGLKRRGLKANDRMCGTPFSIASTTLKCSFKELERIVHEGFQNSRGMTDLQKLDQK